MIKPVLGLLCAFAFFAAPAALAQQDPRVPQLEIEISRLQRELAVQARRIDQLERAAREGEAAAGAARQAPPPTNRSAAWLTLSNWEKIKPGMTATQVAGILGPPNTVRDAEGGLRTLFYALELGPSAILAGNVRLVSDSVSEVVKPVLR